MQPRYEWTRADLAEEPARIIGVRGPTGSPVRAFRSPHGATRAVVVERQTRWLEGPVPLKRA